MSQPKIISLKNDQGEVFASIVRMNDGQWLEIKKNYTFQKSKEIFQSKERWLLSRSNPYFKYNIVYDEREPYESQEDKWKRTPIDARMNDIDFVKEVITKFKIKSQPVKKQITIHDEKTNVIKTILHLETMSTLEYPQQNLEFIKEILEKNKTKLERIEKTISDKQENQAVYNKLTPKTTIGYIQKENTFLPLGYDSINDTLIFDGKYGKDFQSFGFTSRPILWIFKSNKLIPAG